MTEAAALPLAFSDLVADLAERRLLDVTVTAGQAFGGDLEAVNLPSALAVAAVVGRADVVVVGARAGRGGHRDVARRQCPGAGGGGRHGRRPGRDADRRPALLGRRRSDRATGA